MRTGVGASPNTPATSTIDIKGVGFATPMEIDVDTSTIGEGHLIQAVDNALRRDGSAVDSA